MLKSAVTAVLNATLGVDSRFNVLVRELLLSCRPHPCTMLSANVLSSAQNIPSVQAAKRWLRPITNFSATSLQPSIDCVIRTTIFPPSI
jgi:hypothetical protein